RAAVVPDGGAVPHPGFRVDRFPDTAQHPERVQLVLRGDVGAPFYERPDQGGRGVIDADLVFVDDFPVPALVRGVRGAFVDDLGGPIRERPVADVGVSGDPADVGGAPVHVAVGCVVEHGVVGVGGLGEVPA